MSVNPIELIVPALEITLERNFYLRWAEIATYVRYGMQAIGLVATIINIAVFYDTDVNIFKNFLLIFISIL